jgi:hypothetical protein
MFVYVALGADAMPFDLKFLSRTNFDRFLDACARLGCVTEPGVDTEGVFSPSVEMVDSSASGVAAPLLSWVVIKEASFLTASPIIALMFLFRRWFGRQWGFRNGFPREWMSSWSMSCW